MTITICTGSCRRRHHTLRTAAYINNEIPFVCCHYYIRELHGHRGGALIPARKGCRRCALQCCVLLIKYVLSLYSAGLSQTLAEVAQCSNIVYCFLGNAYDSQVSVATQNTCEVQCSGNCCTGDNACTFGTFSVCGDPNDGSCKGERGMCTTP